MTPIHVLSALFLAAFPPPPQHGGPKPAPGSNWVRSSVSPLVLAAKVEAQLHSLSMLGLRYQFQCNTPIGKGFLLEECLFATPKKFHVQYPLLSEGKFPVQKISLVSDGKLLGIKSEATGRVTVKPLPARWPLPSNLVKSWFYGGVGYLFTAVGSATNPLTALVKAANKPGSGYEVYVETRTVTLFKKPTKYDHIIITRTPAQTRKKGRLSYEIAINDYFMLPTSMSNTIHSGPKTYTTDMTRAEWQKIKPPLDERFFDPHQIR